MPVRTLRLLTHRVQVEGVYEPVYFIETLVRLECPTNPGGKSWLVHTIIPFSMALSFPQERTPKNSLKNLHFVGVDFDPYRLRIEFFGPRPSALCHSSLQEIEERFQRSSHAARVSPENFFYLNRIPQR